MTRDQGKKDANIAMKNMTRKDVRTKGVCKKGMTNNPCSTQIMDSMALEAKKTRTRKIQWAGPYLIKKVYDNGTIDITTLEHQELGRVNMNKIKPYYEPKIAATYTLQTLAYHN
jgi:GTP cyclohydrolase FolE2